MPMCHNCRLQLDKGYCHFCNTIPNTTEQFRGYYDEDGIRYITDEKKYKDWKKNKGE